MTNILILTSLLIISNPDMERLLNAIKQVESGGDCNAIGDNGKAIGAYQIHKAYWQDGCKFLKVKWSYSDAKNEAKSRQVVRAYLTHYGKGLPLSALAAIHCSGPKGSEKLKTNKKVQKYVAKILKIMETDLENEN